MTGEVYPWELTDDAFDGGHGRLFVVQERAGELRTAEDVRDASPLDCSLGNGRMTWRCRLRHDKRIWYGFWLSGAFVAAPKRSE